MKGVQIGNSDECAKSTEIKVETFLLKMLLIENAECRVVVYGSFDSFSCSNL